MNKRFLFIVAISCVLYFANLGGSSIYILDEAKNASCAMEMFQRNDLVVPTFNGELRTDKPPLHYFFMMVAYQVGGFTPLAARFFSALAGVLLIVLVYRKVTALIDESTAFLSSLVLLSSLQLAVQFHLAVPDPYLILLLALSFFTFFTGFHDGTKKIYLAYVTLAFAFLTKGLIAIVFPGSVFLIYLLLTKQLNWQSLKRLRLPIGVALFLMIALPWYISVGYATDGQWLKGFFIEHNLDRYTSTMEGHRGFPLAPFAILIGALLPFSTFVIQAASLSIKERKANPFLLYCLIIVFFVGGFFSFSKTILPSYPAPALPFLSIIISYYLKELMQASGFSKIKINLSFIVSLIISVALPIAAYITLSKDSQLVHLKHLALVFTIIPIGTIVGWFAFLKGKGYYFIGAWSGSWIIASLLFFYVVFPKIDQENPVTKGLSMLNSTYTDYRLVAFQQFNPAFVFQYKKPFQVIYSIEELQAITAQDKKVVIITRDDHLEELATDSSLKIVFRCRDLFENHETILLAQ